MSNYRRAREGNLFFFTVVTWKRQRIFEQEHAQSILGNVIREVKQRYPFKNEAFVLLPDHLHCIWRLPDSDYSIRWALIKKEFTKRAKQLFLIENTKSRLKKREGTIWQRRFWEHVIRDEQDYINHCDYIHYNPVKHGLVDIPRKWKASSFHRFVKEGKYPHDWCASGITFDGMKTGE